MLVTRHSESEQNPWSITKFDSIYTKPSSPRMSNFDTPLSTQPDWQGQYSFLPPAEGNLFGHSYAHHHGSSNDTPNPHVTSAAQPRQTGDVDLKAAAEASVSSPLSHRRSVDPLGLRQPKQPSPIPEHPSEGAAGDLYAQKSAEASHQDDAGAGGGVTDSGTAPAVQQADMSGSAAAQAGAVGVEDGMVSKDEDDEVLDDDDMVEGEGGEQNSQPQTAAERTAQRRKMKRFRLTHQQTRFLMSEFAKQPHPDAAHRERLSREIPGLSPRQVQVWFQNRRAKIKRLTADDRDRMIKMRAVPDDFDNVGALHSPYGAVHGLGNPMASPVDFGTPSYADHMMRPLMVEVRRPEGEDHMSPTGLSPAFGSIGFGPSGTMSNPDILSPLSPTSTDRYGGYSGHMSTTPLSAGTRTASNPFARQNSMDGTMMSSQRHGIRPLQPLQLRETMTRSRSDNLQSPLRSSMSWKGDSIDYTTYPGGGGSPQLGGQHGSVYRTDSMNSSSGYDTNSYGNTAVQSPTHMAYPGMSSSTLQQAPRGSARMRAASASTLPLGLDMRNQYRSISSTGAGSPGSAGGGVSTAGGTPRPSAISTAGGSPYGSAYTTSFPSAPLTAPMDFGLSRAATTGSLRNDYSMPQMSAPLNPPADFSQASQAFGSATRTPMRDTFSSGGYGQSTPTATTTGSTTPGGPNSDHSHQQQQYGGSHHHGHNQHQQQQHSQHSQQHHHHHPRPEDYGSDALGSTGLKRKHSFTTVGTPVSGVGSQAYGSTA